VIQLSTSPTTLQITLTRRVLAHSMLTSTSLLLVSHSFDMNSLVTIDSATIELAGLLVPGCSTIPLKF
jgi:hypothetical protein